MSRTPRTAALTAALLTAVLALAAPTASAEPTPTSVATTSASSSGSTSAPGAEPTLSPTPTPTPSASDPAPGPVTSLAPWPSRDTFGLTWTMPADADIARVVIRRTTGTTAPATATEGVQIASGTMDRWTDTGLDRTLLYSYSVFVEDTAGQWSPPASVTGGLLDLGGVFSATATVTSTTSVTLSWSNTVDTRVTGVRITRKATCASTTVDVTIDLPRPATSWTDSSLARNQSACYHLRTYDSEGRPSRSPGVPQGVRTWSAMPVTDVTAAPNADTGSATLSWVMPTDDQVARVVVRRVDEPGNAGAVVFDGTATSFVDTGLLVERTYRYEITTRTAGGLSSPVRAVSTTVSLTWRTDVMAPDRGWPDLLDCATATWCMSIDRSGQFLVLDGTRWSAPALMPTPPDRSTADSARRGLSCPSKGWCLAFGPEGFQRWSGSSWSSVGTTPQPPAAAYTSLTCTSAQWCVAMTYDSRATTFAGGAWTPLTYVADLRDVSWEGVSCQAQARCFAFGIYLPTGSSWRASLVNGRWTTGFMAKPGYRVSDIDCPTTTWCMAVSSWGTWTVSGTRWSGRSSGTRGDTGDSVSCATASLCWATNGPNDVQPWNGAAWGTFVVITPFSFSLEGLACPRRSTTCHAVDSRGRHLRWTSSTGWRVQSTFDETSGFLGFTPQIGCTGATSCQTFDRNGWLHGFDGATWTRGARYFQDTAQTTCLPSGFCLAVQDGGGFYRTFANGTWSAAKAIPWVSTRNPPACGSPTMCLVFDGQGRAFRFNGTGWSLIASPFASLEDGGYNHRIECVSATWCIATAWGGYWSSSNGTAWGKLRLLPAEMRTPGDVLLSCASTSVCLAVLRTGLGARWDGSTWTSLTQGNGAPPYGLAGLDCFAADHCLAVEGFSNSKQPVLYNGFGWSAATPYGTDTASDGGVLCVSPGRCFVPGGGTVTRSVPPVG